ncbi:JIP5 [Candida theae]|uniref:WD repeat-containing protein JIP5 n=1 Tax=Candida theae TaxID=1198502 RepID=A0AAD5BIJ4_9ASCO|nr:JIP5 [Candida theae]KAI5965495.1 JIP5 [Candida theae]
MGKKKSNSASAAQSMESSVAPILEIGYKDPLFTVAAHPTRPIFISGLGTGHLFCNTYDASKLEEEMESRREKVAELDKRAYAEGKIPHVTKSVSQSKTKWWTSVEEYPNDAPEAQTNITTDWKTKRHKGSCRHAIFDPRNNSLGEFVYTCGSDNIIKKAATDSGKVVGKVDVTSNYDNSKDKLTRLCHSTSHPFLLAGSEDGHVFVYDSTDLSSNKLKFKVSQVHDDSINHILSMSQSPYHYLTLGSTTLAHIDIRKGIITQSDDQEDELLAMSYTTDELGDGKADTVLVSHGEGIVTIWRNSKNNLMDQLSRIKINKTASIDAIVPTMNNDSEELAHSVWCGDSDGLLHRINYKRGKVVETRVHSTVSGKYGPVDEVSMLDIDFEYRLISAGMDRLKLWSNKETDDVDEGDDSDDNLSDSENGSGSSMSEVLTSGDSGLDSEDEDDNDANEGSEVDDVEELSEDGDDVDEDTKDIPPAYKRKRRDFSELITKPKTKAIDINKLTKHDGTENDTSQPQSKKQKTKEKKLTTKQIRNMQKHEHGIRRFEGL